MTSPDAIDIAALPADFADWAALLDLINAAFAYMDGVIDPPSSAKTLTPDGLQHKAQKEVCLIARCGGRLVGCAFADCRDNCLYIGKLAVSRGNQRSGIGRRLVHAAEALARSQGLDALELQTRVELTGKPGRVPRVSAFIETERTAPFTLGMVRPTSPHHAETSYDPRRSPQPKNVGSPPASTAKALRWRCASSPTPRSLLGRAAAHPDRRPTHIDGALYHGDSGTLFAEKTGGR
jgi:GNAT superfamily N-acetyltransferase